MYDRLIRQKSRKVKRNRQKPQWYDAGEISQLLLFAVLSVFFFCEIYYCRPEQHSKYKRKQYHLKTVFKFGCKGD
jgi:hypothetical protein